jgi:hypothetical protein
MIPRARTTLMVTLIVLSLGLTAPTVDEGWGYSA